MRQRCAFTLVELLTVVAIVAILAALLMPSLDRAVEVTRRAVCLANVKHTVQACMGYAADERDMLPPSQNSDGSVWAYAFDARNSAGVSQPMGVGLLISTGHLPNGELGAMLHCPSLDTAHAVSVWNTPYHSMDVKKPNWWNGIGASWWDDPAYATRRIVTSYNYRSPSQWRVNGHWQLRSTIVPATMALYADVLDPRFGGRFAHKEGHNVAWVHGGGSFMPCSEDVIEGIAMADGNPCTDGRADPVSDEAIFELFEP